MDRLTEQLTTQRVLLQQTDMKLQARRCTPSLPTLMSRPQPPITPVCRPSLPRVSPGRKTVWKPGLWGGRGRENSVASFMSTCWRASEVCGARMRTVRYIRCAYTVRIYRCAYA